MKLKHTLTFTAMAVTALALSSIPARAALILGTEFTGRTFSGNIVTVNDYTLAGVANPGALNFNGTPAIAFMTSTEAADKAIPIRNAPNWNVLIPISVAGSTIDLTSLSITFEAFSNTQLSKTNISGGFSPNYQPTVRLLDSTQTLIAQQTLDAYAENGNNLVAGWTGNFNFVNGRTILANTNYFLQIEMTGESGNNVGINSFSLNGVAIPESSTALLGGLGLLALLRRRR